MKKISLRLRLIFLFVIIACTVFACAGFLAWKESKETADEFFDTYQMALARTLAGGNWKNINDQTQHSTNKIIKNIRNADEDDDAIGFAIFDRSGKIVFHDNENGKDFKYQDNIGKFNQQKVDDDLWRIVWIVSADDNFVIAVGQELEYREDLAWDIMEKFMAPWIAGIISFLIMITIIISYEFLPLKNLAQNLQKRKNDDLTPLDDNNLPLEIKPLTNAMNFRLNQIAELLQRERRFISDAAHELRTPLTALKVQLDVAKISGDDKKAQEKALSQIGEGLDRTSHLVEQLLALSRLEVSLNSEHESYCIKWGEIIQQLVDEYADKAKAKKQHFKISVSEKGPFKNGDPTLTKLMIRNLIDNAIKYSSENAYISVSCSDNCLEILNSGVTIKEEYLAKLGQRFYRIAGKNEKGSGLGLSIVQCIASYYGCKLEFTNTLNGFSVKILSN